MEDLDQFIKLTYFNWVGMLLLLACSNHTGTTHSIDKGSSKTEIIQKLGEPKGVKHQVKTEEEIWGDEERFWDEIALGTELEVWRYEMENGYLNLYFLGGEDTLSYQGFSPHGVVYESEQ
jgi:hypothetical protein